MNVAFIAAILLYGIYLFIYFMDSSVRERVYVSHVISDVLYYIIQSCYLLP